MMIVRTVVGPWVVPANVLFVVTELVVEVEDLIGEAEALACCLWPSQQRVHLYLREKDEHSSHFVEHAIVKAENLVSVADSLF